MIREMKAKTTSHPLGCLIKNIRANTGMDVEKRKPLYSVDRNVNYKFLYYVVI